MRKVLAGVLAGVGAVSLLAATPVSGPVEIADGCGESDTWVMSESIVHPTPPATDVDTVDLRGRYADDETLTGLDVAIVVCGEAEDVATGETIRVTAYSPADALEGCDRSRVGVTIARSVEDGAWSARLNRDCIVDGDDCLLPLGIKQVCASSTSTELVGVDLPPGALRVDGRTFTVTLDAPELPGAASGFLVEDHVLSQLAVYGSSFAGARLSTGAQTGEGQGAWVSLVETGAGTDHRLGSDRP